MRVVLVVWALLCAALATPAVSPPYQPLVLRYHRAAEGYCCANRLPSSARWMYLCIWHVCMKYVFCMKRPVKALQQRHKSARDWCATRHTVVYLVNAAVCDVGGTRAQGVLVRTRSPWPNPGDRIESPGTLTPPHH